jgi:hypothetical protein
MIMIPNISKPYVVSDTAKNSMCTLSFKFTIKVKAEEDKG